MSYAFSSLAGIFDTTSVDSTSCWPLTDASCSEALCEDETFPERELAALVTAKVYYNLQAYNESMVFALGAGKSLNLDNGGEFEETIICKR